jgi:hypothetical protein|tara:strand:- start:559 stop:1212 length:654 start_codon:yes stop_codon:yes gene_type:complete
MDPLSMALIMGGSAAVKGIGQGISSYQTAQGLMGDEEQEMLKRLQRQQELGMLGYSSGEMSEMTNQYRNPQQAVAKAQGDQLKATMANQGLGAADAFKLAMVQQEQQAEQTAKVADTVNAMQAAERQRDEQLLLGLSAKEAQQDAAKKAAIVQAITLGIGGAVESGAQAALLADQTGYQKGLDAQSLKLQQEYLDTLGKVNPYLTGSPLGTPASGGQ